ncbi:WD and tetratricopeptide repeats protein 1 [Neocloeon triangulifer]|uniref:WD and tetratricopeptide repeats protein 1 n=1 Tax=Neocloeon triangulifer TaxID=2078957 RepID=UPI00286EE6F1|nr:WD and tetratricopeptide repeats protein 1 [Neocloeon triangulifer]XP_059485391.1 WD and tetratricopeptide repeats protein 1 [Neocloeon triangulifer]XP_059485392.1 WD and tetratricopeptide repeats protein 1 [Neocloeon triangulifer]
MEPNTASLLVYRETQDRLGSANVRQKLHVTRSMIERLGLEKELLGHSGCVNCLEWNTKGDILASASDDVQVVLWDPYTYKPLKTIRTGHQGNIFSVKFLPHSGDQTILTGAADNKVRVHDLTLDEPRMICSCHGNRVKRVATAPDEPNLFWSAAEDGCVMQFDLRQAHQCNTETSASILVNLNNHMGAGAEAKCLAINPTRPELLAVGANDPFARLYDRRMITTTTVPFQSGTSNRNLPWGKRNLLQARAGLGDENENIPRDSVRYYSPGHLPSLVPKNGRSFMTSPSAVSTYLTFSSDGNELLVNLGGEQIYLFDTYMLRKPYSFKLPQQEKSNRCLFVPISEKDIQEKVAALKETANGYFKSRSYFKAVKIYNEAIALCPNSAVLYANRAAAFMKRKWEGDDYAAYRDCATALALQPDYMKAHFRLISCLTALHKPDLAIKSLAEFAEKFPDEILSSEYKKLAGDIESDQELLSKIETENKGDAEEETESVQQVRSKQSDVEKIWRDESSDYKLFFCGHCNTTTDIKEANFFGSNAQYIVAGSDDGSFFIWDRHTTNIIKVLKGDDSIVNCLQPHPSTCLLATSGIESTVRLWSPRPENAEPESREVKEMEVAAVLNQKRMRTDPFEMMLSNMSARANEEGVEGLAGVSCRQS